ncbi:MAG: glutathione S-transferase C-terminal domain-containing protein [Synechococcales bacterium]|nr:glutathione S-transferase C-terminal domain-containing protein [Synechococcales bacterium]
MSKTIGLPPKLLIQTGRSLWTLMWQVMMGQLAPRGRAGEYLRPVSQFRDCLPRAVPGRYRLIVGMSCPWAHRTLITRVLKGLEAAIAVTEVVPSPEDGGWLFSAPFAGCQTLAELYQLAQPGYRGRSTVPVLWDDQDQKIVNNESAEIIQILNSDFNQLAIHSELNLYPESLQNEIDDWNDKIYNNVNNGVYRCGFAQTQAAYQEAVTSLFTTLDEIDQQLSDRPYLCGDFLTLADVRLFTTLIRFDVAYAGIFHCSYKRIRDYPHLSRYVRQIYQLPGIAATCELDRVRQDYYGNLFPLNPGGIIPIAPDLSWLA